MKILNKLNNNKDILQLDAPEGHMHDKMDTMPLDTREGSEYDNLESFSLSPSDHDTPSCHSRAQTRESRNKESDSMNKDINSNWIFGSSPNMTRMISQSGRSMVEMLGVLAVIGVLSIGGIAGYSYGMDKYRANETTNQIMLRAIDLMTQAGNENETLSLSAWNNESSQYDFGEVGFTHDDLIYMDVGTQNKLPKRVCEIIYDAMKDMAVQIDINAVRADSNDTCGDDNEMTFYFEGTNNYTCDPACPEGQYCDNGICFKGTKPEGTAWGGDCSSDADCNVGWTGTCAHCSPEGQCWMTGYDGDDCTLTDGTAGQCNLGTCYPKGCTTNDDCKEQPGTYCASPNSSSTERFQSGKKGACTPIDFSRHEIAGQIYYISNRDISWWDAEYACDAIGGKKLLEVDDLMTESDGSKWQGDSGPHTRTALAEELYNFSGNYYIWTKNLVDDTFAVTISLGYKSILDNGIRYINGYLAVCR